MREVTLARAVAAEAGLHELPELGPRYRDVAQERGEAESASNVLERDIAADGIVDAQRAAVDKREIGRRFTERARHLVDNEIGPGCFARAHGLLGGIHGKCRRAYARLEERELLEQPVAPFLVQLRVIGVRFDADAYLDDVRFHDRQTLFVKREIDAPDDAGIGGALHHRRRGVGQMVARIMARDSRGIRQPHPPARPR